MGDNAGLDLAGNNATINALSDVGYGNTNWITNSSADPATLTISDGGWCYGGTSCFYGTISGNLSLDVSFQMPNNCLLLDGTNTYTGGTNVLAGTLDAESFLEGTLYDGDGTFDPAGALGGTMNVAAGGAAYRPVSRQ